MLGFNQRLQAVFGALGDTAEDKGWTIGEPDESHPGREIAEGDSDDEEARALGPLPVLPGSVIDSEGEDDEQERELPSLQRCRAFEEEEDEDEYDRIAVQGTAGGTKDEWPQAGTEVLEDNVFDRHCLVRDAEGAEYSKHQVLPSLVVQHTSARRHVRAGGQRWVPPQERQDYKIPDHVVHPERYTCYTLDEPLVVGSGQTLREDPALEDMRQEVLSVRAAAEPSAMMSDDREREVGRFGGTLEYRPKAVRQCGDVGVSGTTQDDAVAPGRKSATRGLSGAKRHYDVEPVVNVQGTYLEVEEEDEGRVGPAGGEGMVQVMRVPEAHVANRDGDGEVGEFGRMDVDGGEATVVSSVNLWGHKSHRRHPRGQYRHNVS